MRKQKAQIFIMTILVLSTVLTAGVILITIFTRDLRLASETITSVKALYVADSEVERLLYYKFKDTLPTSITYNLSPEPQTNSCMNPVKSPVPEDSSITQCYGCEKVNSECIKSVGTIGSISRGLEVDF